MSGIEPTPHRPNGPSFPGRCLGRCPGRCPGLRNHAPLARLERNPAWSSPTRHWPNGPISLSPGQRPGSGTPIGWRPVGPQSGAAWFGAQRYRTPLVRGDPVDENPGRCPVWGTPWSAACSSNMARRPSASWFFAAACQRFKCWCSRPSTSASSSMRSGWRKVAACGGIAVPAVMESGRPACLVRNSPLR